MQAGFVLDSYLYTTFHGANINETVYLRQNKDCEIGRSVFAVHDKYADFCKVSLRNTITPRPLKYILNIEHALSIIGKKVKMNGCNNQTTGYILQFCNTTDGVISWEAHIRVRIKTAQGDSGASLRLQDQETTLIGLLRGQSVAENKPEYPIAHFTPAYKLFTN